MQEGLFSLLRDAGISIKLGSRGYRPTVSLPGLDAKILKPQNVVEMLVSGSRDVGFAGADWVKELDTNLIEVFDTELDPVRLVAAAPPTLLLNGALPDRPLVVASEYENLTRNWLAQQRIDARIVVSYGATEAFPPDDADFIVDLAASGETLKAQNLVPFAEILTSSTRLYASPAAMADPVRRSAIDRLVMLLRSVLEARSRVMLEVNVTDASLEAVCAALPCMREPTISRLHSGAGYAVKAAVPRSQLPILIPRIRSCGGTDLVVSSLSQIIP